MEKAHNLQITGMRALTIPPASADFDYIVITGSIVYNAASTRRARWQPRTSFPTSCCGPWSRRRTRTRKGAQAIVDAYSSAEFLTYMEENNDGLWWIPEELGS